MPHFEHHEDMSFLLKELPEDEAIKEFSSRYTKLGSPYFEALMRLLKISSDLEHNMEAYFQTHGLSDGRYSILMLLFRCNCPQGFSQSEIAKKMCVSRASMTSFIDSLEKDGYVVRKPDTVDRRLIYIQLTPKGHKKVEAVLPEHMRMMAQFMKCINKTEAEQLYNILDKLLGNLKIFEQCDSAKKE
ncbi:Transcriptional repressor MprA [compost metagenome]